MFDESYKLVWHLANGLNKPKTDCNYLVTIYKSDYSNDKVVTIGSYNFNPISQRHEWLHGERMISFAELPKPF